MLTLNFKSIHHRSAPAQGLTMTSPGLEIIIKMSSLCSVSIDASGRPEQLTLKDIEVLCFIKENSREGHPHYIIRCQYSQLENHKKCLKLHYPNIRVADECNDPNTIHRWNRFKREVIKKLNYYKIYFSLKKEKRELLDAVIDVTIQDQSLYHRPQNIMMRLYTK